MPRARSVTASHKNITAGGGKKLCPGLPINVHLGLPTNLLGAIKHLWAGLPINLRGTTNPSARDYQSVFFGQLIANNPARDYQSICLELPINLLGTDYQSICLGLTINQSAFDLFGSGLPKTDPRALRTYVRTYVIYLNIVLFDFAAIFDHDWCRRRALGRAADRLELADDIHALGDLAEDDMPSVQEVGLNGADEELQATKRATQSATRGAILIR